MLCYETVSIARNLTCVVRKEGRFAEGMSLCKDKNYCGVSLFLSLICSEIGKGGTMYGKIDLSLAGICLSPTLRRA